MTTKGKLTVLTVFCAILSFLSLIAAYSIPGSDSDLIRFHVIANSDSVFDQSVKLAVRDGIIDEVNGLLENIDDPEEARSVLKQNKEKITAAANRILDSCHCGYRAEAVLGESLFPTKSYGDITLPAGEYEALRVILGEGEGKNWWCVLYPPLCFVDIKDDTAIAVTTAEEFHKEDGEVFAVDGSLFQIKIKSKLLEFLR